MSVATEAAIRPFKVEIPEADLQALRQRIQAVMWPEKETVSDQSQGPQLETMRELARYAWMLDHDAASLALISRSFAGVDEGLTRDDVLDNITLSWLTNSGVSASRLYAENKFSFFGTKGVKLPVAISVFPDELYRTPQSWAQKAYPNLMHFNQLPKGGHFAAWEQPMAYTDEVRTGLRSLR